MRRSPILVMCVATLASSCAASHHGATPPATPHSNPAAAAARLVAQTAPWRLTAPRSRAVAVADGSRILVLGGLAGGTSTPSVLSIDPGAGTVAHAGTLAEPVHDAAGAEVGGAAHVFGGGRAGSVDAVQTYSAAGSHVTGHLPRPRSDLAADVVDGRAYLAGGFDGARVSPYVLSSDDGNTFRIAGTLAAGVRYPAIAAVGQSIYVVGGSTATTESSATGQVDLVQRFDIATGKTTVVAHLPHVLAHASAFVIGGEIFVAGGVIGRSTQDAILRIDPATGTVGDAGTLPGPRSDAAAVSMGDVVWLIGGENGGPTAPLDTVVSVRRQR